MLTHFAGLLGHGGLLDHPMVGGMLGLIGFLGLVPFRSPVAAERSGQSIRRLGLVGLAGFAGLWIPGAGAMGAAGALGLWNHQNRTFALLSVLGWAWLAGLPFVYGHFAQV